MKIFISWSGERSKLVAVALKGWIKMILQATEPWISTNDIDGGSVWFNKITEQLKESQTSIICLTPENVNEPWILFEAGAVAKGAETNRVCTLLIGLNPTDIKGPLAQFNHTPCTMDGFRKLLGDLNKALKQPLDETGFSNIFDALWPKLSSVIDEALKKALTASTKKGRSQEDMLAEILERIRTIENQTAPPILPLNFNEYTTPDISKKELENSADFIRKLDETLAAIAKIQKKESIIKSSPPRKAPISPS